MPARLLALLVGCTATAAVAAGPEGAVNGYRDFAALSAELKRLDADPLIAVDSLGKTPGGRELWLLAIGRGDLDGKPAILIVGDLDPRRLTGGEVSLRLARRLTEKAGQPLLDRVTFYILPRPAPDAAEAFFQRPYQERAGAARAIDDDADGAVDEDGPEDLNGDGWITSLRVEDPTGGWVENPGDKRLLVRADPAKGQQGRWRLLIEGIDNDGDEQFGEDPPGGVAIDRNFPFRYEAFAAGAGPYAASEVETRALADFCYRHPHIALVWSFSAHDNLVEPWKPEPAQDGQKLKTAVLAADVPYFARLGELYREAFPTRSVAEPAVHAGGFVPWAYFHYGRWSLGSRGWSIPADDKPTPARKDGKSTAEPGKNAAKPEPKKGEQAADELAAIRWLDREKIDGFVPWQPIKHPAFADKRAEVGGFRPFVRTNPPAAMLDGVTEGHWTFLTRLVELLPRLEIVELKHVGLAKETSRIEVRLANVGWLPTTSKMGELNGVPPRLQIAVDPPAGVRLATGSPRRLLKRLATGEQVEQSWLLVGPAAEVKVRAWSASVGATSKTASPPRALEKK